MGTVRPLATLISEISILFVEEKSKDMDTASLNEEKLKEVFTIEQVACALAGVSCKQAASAQVTRH
ncbi:MAG: hypothetical protein KC413_03405, partial [Anaerolineales bacterium]|nr:hypothetical protein [Anaerolineales bacterium]